MWTLLLQKQVKYVVRIELYCLSTVIVLILN